MLLKIAIPKELMTENLMTQVGIPCVCSIWDEFEVQLHSPLPAAGGKIEGWSSEEIDYRAPAAAGGTWKQHAHSRITLREVADDTYEVMDLDMFYPPLGWLPVIAGGAYAEPLKGLYDEEK